MTDTSKQIHDWQEKVRASFGDESKMYHYLFETLENFFYRYLETSENKNLKATQIADHIWGAYSFESNMVEALKTKGPAKPGIMELAKTVPKAQNPKVRYGILVEVSELNPDKGRLTIKSEINWGFPEFKDSSKLIKNEVLFKYDDLAQFRKGLALKLEEAAGLFLE